MIKGLVSCIIPTYRRSDMLERAIRSALNQTYNNIEVLIVDDNNPDDEYSLIVQERISSIDDNRLYYIQQECHKNGAAARNKGIKAAKGEFVCFLDDDDEWIADKIEKQLIFIDKFSEDVGAVSCLATTYKNNLEYSVQQQYEVCDLHKKVLIRSVSINTDSVLFKKVALDKAGYFNESFLRHQEIQLFLDFLLKFEIRLLPEYLLNIHIDDGQNRVNLKKMIEVKDVFFNQMKNHFDKYNKKQKKRIYAAHYFEIVLLALREKNIFQAFLWLCKIGIDIGAYKDLMNRIRMRRRSLDRKKRGELL